jgi:hypothetical protein
VYTHRKTARHAFRPFGFALIRSESAPSIQKLLDSVCKATELLFPLEMGAGMRLSLRRSVGSCCSDHSPAMFKAFDGSFAGTHQTTSIPAGFQQGSRRVSPGFQQGFHGVSVGFQ